jgi:hypothetical protein
MIEKKYETPLEHKKFMYGSMTAFMIANVVFIYLKFKYLHNYSYHTWSSFLFPHFFSLGIGHWIYRKRTPSLPHFWIGIITYSLIAATLFVLFYSLGKVLR